MAALRSCFFGDGGVAGGCAVFVRRGGRAGVGGFDGRGREAVESKGFEARGSGCLSLSVDVRVGEAAGSGEEGFKLVDFAEVPE